VGAVLLKARDQPVVFVHRSPSLLAYCHNSDRRSPTDVTKSQSHSSAAFGHSSDERNWADVAGGSAPVDSVETGMASIRVQRRHLKTPGGEQPCKHG
jgi:hypothetical protein